MQTPKSLSVLNTVSVIENSMILIKFSTLFTISRYCTAVTVAFAKCFVSREHRWPTNFDEKKSVSYTVFFIVLPLSEKFIADAFLLGLCKESFKSFITFHKSCLYFFSIIILLSRLSSWQSIKLIKFVF